MFILSMSFGKYMHECNHDRNRYLDIFITTISPIVTLLSSSPSLTLIFRKPLVCPLSAEITFVLFRVSYTLIHLLCSLLCWCSVLTFLYLSVVPSIFIAVQYSIALIYHNLSSHLYANGPSGCVQCQVIVNKGAVKVHMQVFVWTYVSIPFG